jgi:3'(2'), 5'-bisphosphate nucleotidase
MNENSLELKAGLRALADVSKLCIEAQKRLGGSGWLMKEDRSPVTVADFAAQAVICKRLRDAFPEDAIIAEEDSGELQKPDRSDVLEAVTGYVRRVFPGVSQAEVCDWIDFSSRSVAQRFWVVDPIDGTKGFLRGAQYAVAIGLIENRRVKLGMMACPNLHLDPGKLDGPKGCIFFAVRGEGSVQMDLDGGRRRKLSTWKGEDLSEVTYTESVESDHSDHHFHEAVAAQLNINRPPLRVDSEAKYGIVARGEAVFYLRMPSPSEAAYTENIWDHAPGSIITEEAGGTVTDALGRHLDFFTGIKMTSNYGIVATNGSLHDGVLDAVRRLRGKDFPGGSSLG